MKTFKKVQKTTEVVVVDSHTCDLCKEDIDDVSSAWRASCKVEMRFGRVLPEGDMSKTTRFDVCVDCFEDKLMPLLQQVFGATPRVFDTEDGEAG